MDEHTGHIIQVKAKLIQSLSFNQAKAMALIVYMKAFQKEYPFYSKDYSLSTLHTITGLHLETIKKRLIELEIMGLLGYSERKNRYLFLSTCAHNKHRNQQITIKSGLNIKEVEKIILAIRLKLKLQQKEFMRNALSIAHDTFHLDGTPAKVDEIKRARKYLREHCNVDYSKRGFIDYGWSYKGIAKYIGTSVAKAVEIVKYAVENNYIVKHTHSMYKHISDKVETLYIQHTFSLGAYSYKVWANTYAPCTGIN